MAKKEKSKEKEIGVVSNYFKHVKAAAIKLSAPLKKGEKIKIMGGDKEVELTVGSMEIDRKPIEKAKKGDEIGLLVPEDVHKGNKVYKI
jgi:putative protease